MARSVPAHAVGGGAALHSNPRPARGGNEDAGHVDPALGVAIVADGLGGMPAGRLASDTAVEVIRRRIALAAANAASLDDSRLASLVAGGLIDANAAISDLAALAPDCAGMAASAAVAWLVDDRIVVAHVGDCRVYLYRDDGLRRLTRDHTLAEYGLDAPPLAEVRPRERRKNRLVAGSTPLASILTGILGASAQVSVDTRVIPAWPGDVVLVCSDGLTDAVDDSAIASIVDACDGDSAAIALALSMAAGRERAADDVTIAVLGVADDAAVRDKGAGFPEQGHRETSDKVE
ncbi:MAG: serine/threonine-protein phosphatase [Burkholderiaceae bacterium]|nr:serine/threonine-protein phosphatase [Burkholderiaceae bacterium]